MDLRILKRAASDQCQVDPDTFEDILPATPLQEGLMASTAKDPTAYVSRQIWTLPDDIDLERFESAWRTVSRSVALLRTRFFAHGSRAFPTILHATAPCHVVDSLEAYLQDDRGCAYGLGDRLARFAVIKRAKQRPVFV